MVRSVRGVRYIMQVMTRLPSCCLLTSTLTLLFVSLVIMDFVFAEETTAKAKTTTTAEPFLQSTMFVGLAAGIGGFIGFAILCCILWKCCCGSKDD